MSDVTVYQPKRHRPFPTVHDKNLVLKIVEAFSPYFSLRSSEVRRLYNWKAKKPITSRHVLNLLRKLEAEGKVKLTVKNVGRRGRVTFVEKA